MLNRRTFLKTGLTTGAAVIPLAAAFDALTLPAQETTSSSPPCSPRFRHAWLQLTRPRSPGSSVFAAWARAT